MCHDMMSLLWRFLSGTFEATKEWELKILGGKFQNFKSSTN